MRIVKRLLWSIPAVSKLAGPLEDFVVATVAAADVNLDLINHDFSY